MHNISKDDQDTLAVSNSNNVRNYDIWRRSVARIFSKSSGYWQAVTLFVVL